MAFWWFGMIYLSVFANNGTWHGKLLARSMNFWLHTWWCFASLLDGTYKPGGEISRLQESSRVEHGPYSGGNCSIVNALGTDTGVWGAHDDNPFW